MKKITWEKWKDFLKEDGEHSGNIVIPTPIGMISHKISANTNGRLNFWVGNSNFDINALYANIIQNVDGVDIFDLWTPYKFRVCIGKSFKTKDVLKNISISTGCDIENNKLRLTQDQINIIKSKKKDISNSKFWAIYILPNGGFEYINTDDNEEFLKNFTIFKDLKTSIGGRLLSPVMDKMVY